jgi:hypothetical protein
MIKRNSGDSLSSCIVSANHPTSKAFQSLATQYVFAQRWPAITCTMLDTEPRCFSQIECPYCRPRTPECHLKAKKWRKISIWFRGYMKQAGSCLKSRSILLGFSYHHLLIDPVLLLKCSTVPTSISVTTRKLACSTDLYPSLP